MNARGMLTDLGTRIEVRTTHFYRWLHFARDLMLINAIKLHLTVTTNMMADYFTKPVDKTKFIECRDYLLTRVE